MKANSSINSQTGYRIAGGWSARTFHKGMVARARAVAWPWPLPAESVVAVLDDGAGFATTMGKLETIGVHSGDVWTASGQSGARWLRDSFAQRGLFSRLASMLNEEDELVARLEAMSADGATVMLVRAPRGRSNQVIEAFEQSGASVMRRMGRWVYAEPLGAR